MTLKPRTHFVRILNHDQIRRMVNMLNTVADPKVEMPDLAKGPLTFDIKAPDGDSVFKGAVMDGKHYVCAMHREVFDEGVTAGAT